MLKLNIVIEKTLHLFPKKLSNGWQLVYIDNDGILKKDKFSTFDDYYDLWKKWQLHLSLNPTKIFRKSIWSIISQFQTDCLLNVFFILGFIIISLITLLITSLNHVHTFLVLLIAPIVITSLFFQVKHLFFWKVAYQIILKDNQIIVSFMSGKVKHYKYDEIVEAQLDVSKTMPIIKFKDGFKEQRLVEYSNVPLLIDQLSKKIS